MKLCQLRDWKGANGNVSCSRSEAACTNLECTLRLPLLTLFLLQFHDVPCSSIAYLKCFLMFSVSMGGSMACNKLDSEVVTESFVIPMSLQCQIASKYICKYQPRQISLKGFLQTWHQYSLTSARICTLFVENTLCVTKLKIVKVLCAKAKCEAKQHLHSLQLVFIQYCLVLDLQRGSWGSCGTWLRQKAERMPKGADNTNTAKTKTLPGTTVRTDRHGSETASFCGLIESYTEHSTLSNDEWTVNFVNWQGKTQKHIKIYTMKYSGYVDMSSIFICVPSEI